VTLVTSTPFDAIVIGGGLAGATTAIRLAENGWNILVLEKTLFPRNKVCGEFLSPAVWSLFEALGITQKILAQKGSRVHKASFIWQEGRQVEIDLPFTSQAHPYGYGLSRKSLDKLLLTEAQERGCLVRENQEVRQIKRMEQRFVISAFDFEKKQHVEYETLRVINTAGKFNRWYHESPSSSHHAEEKRIGFKAHFEGPSLNQKVQLVFFKGGYLGLIEIENNQCNLCGTVNTDRMRPLAFDFDKLLDEIAGQNAVFRDWYQNAKRKTVWLSCGPQTHQFYHGYQEGVFYAGDAACSLEPFLGQGMLMAVAGGFFLASLLSENSTHDQEMNALGKNYEESLKKLYRSKIRFGKFLNFVLGDRPGKHLFRRDYFFRPIFLRYAARKVCEIPGKVFLNGFKPASAKTFKGYRNGYRNTWHADDESQSQRLTVPEPVEIPPSVSPLSFRQEEV